MAMLLLLKLALADGSACPNEQSIKESLERVHIPGAVIIVVNATDTLFARAFGHQSFTPLQPMDVDKSIFPLASISKTFIATAVMQLVEDERVDLDADINQYLKEPQRRIYHRDYPQHAITLRKLLSHTASIGIPPNLTNLYYRADDTALDESLADFSFKQINPSTSYWLRAPPGRVASYSNEGSALAALVVERVTNTSYIDYVREQIIRPLGLDTTRIGVRIADFPDRQALVKHYAYAHNASALAEWKKMIPQLNITQDPSPMWLHIPHLSFAPYPAGLLRMSARALSVYLQMFLKHGKPVLREPRSIAEMKNVVGGGLIHTADPQATPSPFGLSWYWNNMTDGRRYIGHSGSMLGMAHLMLVNEKHTIGMILLTNGDASMPTNASAEMAKVGQEIPMSLFQCFDPVHVSASARVVRAIGVVTFILLLVGGSHFHDVE